MNKALFFCLVSLLALSCERGNERHRALSSGRINHISVIVDDLLWSGEVGDTLRTKFASPVTGLPQEEPLFTINQYPLKLLEGFATNTRNIIVIKTGETRYEVRSKKLGSPQNIIRISGRNIPELLSIIEKKAPEIVSLMKQTEIEQAQKTMDSALHDPAVIQSRFGVDLNVPTSYRVVREGKDFLWLKREIISGNMSVIIYQLPAGAIVPNGDLVNSLIKTRDSIGASYIHGTVPDSPMITEGAYAPYVREVEIAGRSAVEAKGTWELKNDFMSGPFITYAIQDPDAGRTLVLEGFCYAPSKEKRDLMHELEAIIKTINFR